MKKIFARVSVIGCFDGRMAFFFLVSCYPSCNGLSNASSSGQIIPSFSFPRNKFFLNYTGKLNYFEGLLCFCVQI